MNNSICVESTKVGICPRSVRPRKKKQQQQHRTGRLWTYLLDNKPFQEVEVYVWQGAENGSPVDHSPAHALSTGRQTGREWKQSWLINGVRTHGWRHNLTRTHCWRHKHKYIVCWILYAFGHPLLLMCQPGIYWLLKQSSFVLGWNAEMLTNKKYRYCNG